MYVEHLQTPHPEKRNGVEPQLLLNAVEPDTIRRSVDGIARVHGVHAASTAGVYAADMISREVGKSLWFPVRNGGQDDFKDFDVVNPPAPESIWGKQVTNCFGYTIVLSEMLERSGISHYVGYAASHAFTVVKEQTESGERLWYNDALYPSLNHDMTDQTTVGNLPDDIDTQIAASGRSSFKLSAREFMCEAGHELAGFVSEFRWPVINQTQLARLQHGDRNERFMTKFISQQLIVSLFEQETGRELLDAYARFRQAVALADADTAFDELIRMDGQIPEIDVRSDQHSAVKQLVSHFADHGDNERALRVIDEYFRGFSVSNHPNVDVMKGDLLKLVGRRTNEIGLAKTALKGALALYHAASHKQDKATIAGRIIAAQRQLAKLE